MGIWCTISPVPLAWRQLTQHHVRFAAAVMGVTFAVVLVLMQLGFRGALYASAVRLHEHLKADLVLINPQYAYLGMSKPFSQRRLYQARAHPAVASATPLSFDLAPWKNPKTGLTRAILVIGVDPAAPALELPGVTEQLYRTRLTDTLLFDADSRPEFGVRPALLQGGERFVAELAQRRVFISGAFHLGTGFAVDGNTIASRSTFQRLFPNRREGLIDVGLLRLRPGVDVDAVRAQLAAQLPKDVEVLTTAGFIAREQKYWADATPIGYVFAVGVIIGLAVGAVIVYLVLFVNVSERLPEYATLKAIGFTDRALFSVVLQQAIILAALGFTLGTLLSRGLYALAADATHLPLNLTPTTGALVFGLTLLMCGVSGAAALRKVQAADPAEVFA
ncbi:MAG: ABC transporter permease DevC [Candidatus Binatia bacterium]